MTWRLWLAQPSFWVVAMVYMLTRLAVNVSQVYLSIYVQQWLQLPPTAIATVPLLVFLASLAATLGMKRLAGELGWLWAFSAGAGALGVACGGFFLATPHTAWLVYPSAILLGLGSAVVSVLSVSAEADLIGAYTDSGAFVFGAISLTDKLSNGAAVMAIQAIGDGIHDAAAHASYVRYVNAVVPLVAMALAVLVATRLSSVPPPSPAGARSAMPSPGRVGKGGVKFKVVGGAEEGRGDMGVSLLGGGGGVGFG